MAIETIKWEKDCVKLIDQTKLPSRFDIIYCRNVKTLWQAIKQLKVRGAPALGVAAGFGVLLGMKTFRGKDVEKFILHLDDICDYISTSRPTAVNLFNVLDRMRNVYQQGCLLSVEEIKRALKKEALAVFKEDQLVCRQMGKHGAKFIKTNDNIMTICNAGALATADYGTALGVMYAAKSKGKKFNVFACETRPLLQGARLTAWELTREKISTTLICDSMAASVMRDKNIKAIFTGADRIAANGDTANKIGTYSLAILAKFHKIPFYVVAPYSTFDMKIKTGQEIPIEERDRLEIVNFMKQKTAPENVNVYNPAFDVTNHSLISAIITEKGPIFPPFKTNIAKMFT